MSEDRPKQRIAERLDEAGLSQTRFMDVKDGEKASIDHETHPPGEVSGNYGIYAKASDQLALLDIDDYDDVEDKSGITALHSLPPTLEQGSPHGGTHRVYKVEPTDDGRLVAAAMKDTFGAKNPKPSWGEIRVHNQYVVGAGSQLDGCTKEWCNACAESDGGYYVLQEDREIATVSADKFLDALKDDPKLSAHVEDAEDESRSWSNSPAPPDDVQERLEYARECDDKLDRLMRGDYSDYRDSSADGGVDRSKAERALAFKLAFWLGDDEATIERVLDHDARTQKWAERDDDSYRDYVLAAVSNQDEFYNPSQTDTDPTFSPDVNWDEVDRGEAILEAERGITDPHGALIHQDGCYGYHFEKKDENGNPYTEFVAVTNFTLETEHVIDTYEGKLLTLKVHPASPMEDPYTVQVKPTVFNAPATFSEEVVRGRTTYFNPVKGATEALNDLRLTVGHQHAPKHRGTEYIGLHGDDYEEWVTPAGTLGPDGWIDEPTYKYYEKGGSQDMESSLEDKWALDPDEGADYDPETVAEICRRVPKTRTPARGLPILGWFYAAPLKPVVHDQEGEFNLLQVTGDTEAGKTSTLQLFYQLFGADPAPFGCGDTNFTIEKKFAGSCGLPIWLDEYKPTDLSERKLNWLHRRLREVTREKSVSKGQTDLGEITFKMRAPVVFSGEQTVTEAAVRRRTVMTHLTDKATGGDYQQAFCELTGASYTDDNGRERYPEGYDLYQHARAFYRYILEQDPETLQEAWQEAREQTRDHLRTLNVADLDGSEFQGLQTVVFGIQVYREFATAMGVAEDELPSEQQVRDALAHSVSNIGPEGRRREHIDEFTELLAQAASAGYLDEGVHHRVFHARKFDCEALAFHMPTAFSAVKKYVREFNIEDEHSLLSKNDYVDSFRVKADQQDSYPLSVNHRVNGIDNGAKAVLIDPHRAAAVLPDGFNLSAFTDDDEDGEAGAASGGDDDDGPSPLATIEDGDTGVRVEGRVNSVETDTPDPIAQKAKIEDTTGEVEAVIWADAGQPKLKEGECYRFSDVKVDTFRGDLQVSVQDYSTISVITSGIGLAPTEQPEDENQKALADGNGEGPPEDADDLKADAQRLAKILTDEGRLRPTELYAQAGDRYDLPPDRAEAALDKAKEMSIVFEPTGDEIEAV